MPAGNKIAIRAIGSMSESTRKLNPHLLYGNQGGIKTEIIQLSKKQNDQRVRQDSKPLMNKLESGWHSVLKLCDQVDQSTLRAQAIRFKLANGAWYKPDITAIVSGKQTAWECKGPKQMKGIAKGMLTIKVAAAQWPEVEFRLVWKQDGRWHQQIILS